MQMGGGPRAVNDSWEHMWWDNLHWKRWVGTDALAGPLWLPIGPLGKYV